MDIKEVERGTVSKNKIYKWPIVTIMAYSYSLDQHVPIVLPRCVLYRCQRNGKSDYV